MNKDTVAKWLQDAIADGWDAKPAYRSEPLEHAAKLYKDGFIAVTLNRPPGFLGDVHEVNVWGPDGLAIEPSDEYSWDALVEGLRICSHCGATDVETTQFSFAGRVCLKCRGEIQEPVGWTR